MDELILLSRKAANAWRNNDAYYQAAVLIDSLCDRLEKTTATSQTKGEWATEEEDLRWGNSIKRKYCTNCGKRPSFDRETGRFILTDFCSSCGADMRRRENDG